MLWDNQSFCYNRSQKKKFHIKKGILNLKESLEANSDSKQNTNNINSPNNFNNDVNNNTNKNNNTNSNFFINNGKNNNFEFLTNTGVVSIPCSANKKENNINIIKTLHDSIQIKNTSSTKRYESNKSNSKKDDLNNKKYRKTTIEQDEEFNMKISRLNKKVNEIFFTTNDKINRLSQKLSNLIDEVGKIVFWKGNEIHNSYYGYLNNQRSIIGYPFGYYKNKNISKYSQTNTENLDKEKERNKINEESPKAILEKIEPYLIKKFKG